MNWMQTAILAGVLLFVGLTLGKAQNVPAGSFHVAAHPHTGGTFNAWFIGPTGKAWLCTSFGTSGPSARQHDVECTAFALP
jgi:hypothetical protein